MADEKTVLKVKDIREETAQMCVITLAGEKAWPFVPGQIAVLGIEGMGESYFAIASAPEDTSGMEFLVKKGGGVAEALCELKKGDSVHAKGPVGKGYPIDQYKGRNLILVCAGSAISPMRSVLRSISRRRGDFGKVVLIYGARFPGDFAFKKETADWQNAKIEVLLSASRPEGNWKEKTGHVQNHFAEAVKTAPNPVVLLCGMKAMMEESRTELAKLGVAAGEILSNY